MVKTAGLYLVPVKGYSKNGHPYLILKRVLVLNQLINRRNLYIRLLGVALRVRSKLT
jgi:hypothetical protein